MCDRAADTGLALSPTEAQTILGELQARGVLPQNLSRGTRSPLPGQSEFNRAVLVLQGMANPVRLAILSELANGERSVGELRDLVGLQPSALSQHLARLRVAGLVTTRRDATRIYYSLAENQTRALLRGLRQAVAL
ncbi:ArsR/SmtB family transcription factor [Magnetospirillum moscoviense]|nr:metalloregulator ArsR/SmtB family transcription factor [Magnetospirillum moscoviense]